MLNFLKRRKCLLVFREGEPANVKASQKGFLEEVVAELVFELS